MQQIIQKIKIFLFMTYFLIVFAVMQQKHHTITYRKSKFQNQKKGNYFCQLNIFPKMSLMQHKTSLL